MFAILFYDLFNIPDSRSESFKAIPGSFHSVDIGLGLESFAFFIDFCFRIITAQRVILCEGCVLGN